MIETPMIHLLMPGLQKKANQYGCQLHCNGVLPVLECDGIYMGLDALQLEEWAHTNEYTLISRYIGTKCMNQ